MELIELKTKFHSALLKGDKYEAEKLFDTLIELNKGLFFLYDVFLKEALYSVGHLWEKGKISVATEHLASAIVESLLNKVYRNIPRKALIQKSVVVTCVENEYHQIGSKMVADIFEKNGWSTYFLGVSAPFKDTLELAKEHQVELIALSMSIYFNLPTLELAVSRIHDEMPNANIIIGGQAFTHGGREVFANDPQVFYFPNLKQLDEYLLSNK